MRKIFTVFAILWCFALSAKGAGWVPVANISTSPTTGCFSWVIGKRVFVSGGTNSKQMWEYDPVHDSWSSLGDMGGSMYHTFAFAFVANGKGYAIGGDTATGIPTAAVWEYDPFTNKWARKGAFPGGGRKSGFCFVINNIAYLGAGNDGTHNMEDFWKYDPASNQWTNLGTAPMGTVHHPATFVISNKGYVCGGEIEVPGFGLETQNALWEYDPSGTGWTSKQSAPDDRVGGVGFSVAGSGYLAGGFKDPTVSAKDIWKYNPATDKWTPAIDQCPDNFTVFATGFVIDTTYYLGAGVALSTSGLLKTAGFYMHGNKPSGINNMMADNNDIHIYPNPCSTEAIIYLDIIEVKPCIITVYDMTGRPVIKQESTAGKIQINTASLVKGSYLICLSWEEQIYTAKLNVE